MSQVLQSLAQSVQRSGYGWWSLDPNMKALSRGRFFEANALRAAIESHPSSPLIEILYNKLCEAYPPESIHTPPLTPLRHNPSSSSTLSTPYPDFEQSQHGCYHTHAGSTYGPSHAGSTCGHNRTGSTCASEGGLSSDMTALVTRAVEEAVRTALEAPEKAVMHECTNVPRNDLQAMYGHFKDMELGNKMLSEKLQRAYGEIEELKARLTKINHNSCHKAIGPLGFGYDSQSCVGDISMGLSAQMPGFGHNNCATAIEALEIDLRYHKNSINSLGEDFAAQLVDTRQSIHSLREDFLEKLASSNHDQCSAAIKAIVTDVQSNRKSIDSKSSDFSAQLNDVRESINSLREEFVEKLSGINHNQCSDTIGALTTRVESSEALIQKLNTDFAEKMAGFNHNECLEAIAGLKSSLSDSQSRLEELGADFAKFNHDECSQAIAKLEIDLCANGNRIDIVSTEFATRLKESNDNHKKTIGDVKAELQQHINTFNGELHSTWTGFVTENSEAMNIFKSDLEERMDSVSAEFAVKLADFNNENSETTSNLQADLRANQDRIEAVSTELATKLRESNNNNAKNIDDVKTDLQDRFDGFVKELDSNMSKFATESTEAIKMIKTDLDERIDDVSAEFDTKLRGFNDSNAEAIKSVSAEFATKLRESDNNNAKAMDNANNCLLDRIEDVNSQLNSGLLKVGNEAMDVLDTARADFEKRIDDTSLEFAKKLTAFNDENSKTTSDLEASLRSNKEHIDSVSADLTAKLASLSSDNTQALDNLNTSLSESNERMDTIAADFDKKLRDSNSHHTKAITGLSTDLRSTRDQVYDSSSAIENLQAGMRSVDGRIKDNAKAIVGMESLLNTTKDRFDTLDLTLSSEFVSMKNNNTKTFRNLEVDISANKQGIEELSASVSKIQEAVDHFKCPGELGKLRESVKHNKDLIDKLHGSINNNNKKTTESLKDLKMKFDTVNEIQKCQEHLVRNLEAKARQNGYPQMVVAQSITPPPE